MQKGYSMLDLEQIITKRSLNFLLFFLIAQISSFHAFAHQATVNNKQETSITHKHNSLTINSLFKKHQNNDELITAAHYTFSGAIANKINYVQLCQATDSTCRSCDAGFSVINSGTPAPYSRTGTTYGINPTAIANYLTGHGFGAGTYNINLYVQSQNLVCQSASAYCSSDIDSNGNLLCMQAVYDGTNVMSLTQIDDGNSTLTGPAKLYLYPADPNTHNIFRCTMNHDGTINACDAATGTGGTPPNWTPYALEFATINSVTYAYSAQVSTFPGSVFKCAVNTDGSFSNCANTPLTQPGWMPYGLRVATIGGTQYMYLSDQLGNVNKCNITINGALEKCGVTKPTNFTPDWQPVGLAFTMINKKQHMYIADDRGSVFFCDLQLNGNLQICNITPVSSAPVWRPARIIFAISNLVKYAYVSDTTNNKIYKCTLNVDGSFNLCNVTPIANSPQWSPHGMEDRIVNGIHYLYVSDAVGGNLYQCTIDLNGELTNCQITPGIGHPNWQPHGLSALFIAG